jgi:hypothetical protein
MFLRLGMNQFLIKESALGFLKLPDTITSFYKVLNEVLLAVTHQYSQNQYEYVHTD